MAQSEMADSDSEHPLDWRALFGEDPASESDDAAPDISEQEKAFLRAALTAGVSAPPPSTLTVETVLAAAPASRSAGQAERPTDEVAARRRRRIRSALLAAAALVAVVAIGVPLMKSGTTSTAANRAVSQDSTAAAGSYAAGSSAAAAGGPLAAASQQPEPSSSSTHAPSLTAGTSAAATQAAGGQSAAAAAAPPEATEPSVAAAGNADVSCRWPELPRAVDPVAARWLGPVVVGSHRALEAPCSGERVAGGVFEVAGGGPAGIIVQVQRPAQPGDCAVADVVPCRKVAADAYTATVGNSRIVWVYRAGTRVRVSAAVTVKITDQQLAGFARGIAAIVP